MAKNDEAFVFKKRSFYISTGITLALIIVGFIITFTSVKLQATSNCSRIDKLETGYKGITEIQYNLKSICDELKITYIEIKE